MIGIYKITNPKGKVYVGQTVDTNRRKDVYKRLNCKGQIKLYNSLVKYGFSEHVFEVVEQCKVGELNTRERHWQDFYNVVGELGLNCKLTKTEDKSGKMSEEAIVKMRTAKLGKKQSAEQIYSRTKNQKGKKLGPKSIEVRLKISKAKTGVKTGPFSQERRAGLKGKRGPQKNPAGLQQRVICPYCKKEGGISGMQRYHFEKCKIRVGSLE